ncbi:MAG: TonB-dependent receptor [Myxococcales bacterium]|nr:TonB-dependent receptor [Myxococcales bacterium]
MRLALIALLAPFSLPAAALADAPKGTIKGTILFEGEPPERATLDRKSDPWCKQAETSLADDVVVTKGKLAGVLVRVANGSAGTHAAPATPAVLDQRGCAYTPHVVGLVAGQKLAVRNSDGTVHNVHARAAGKDVLNKMQGVKAADLPVDTATAKPGDVLELSCGVHPWMRAYAVVQDHPYFAVTGTDGAFAITGLAPGSYTLEAWHPTLGAKSMPIKIGTGPKASITARFSYKP